MDNVVSGGVCMYVRMYVCHNVCMYVCMYTCMYVYECMYGCIYLFIIFMCIPIYYNICMSALHVGIMYVSKLSI